MFEFKYLLNNQLFKTEQSNDDVLIIKEQSDDHFFVKIKALKDIVLDNSIITFPFEFNKHDTIFVNGFQSWTDTKEFEVGEHLRDVRKIPHLVKKMFALDKYGDSEFVNYKKDVFSGIDIAYLRGEHNLFFGSVNYKNSYMIVYLKFKEQLVELNSDIKGRVLNKDEEFTVFDFYLDQDIQRGFMNYVKHFGIEKKEKLIGYTSWYNHYQNINESLIYDALKGMDKNKYNVFQIDDGYETYVGDWLYVDHHKFPNGLEKIVRDIHDKGLLAGLWLAPFAAEEKSILFKSRPDLFIKDEQGNFIKAGGNWSGFYALDMEKEESQNYVRECLQHYMDLGFDFFKLDFLYASCLGKSKLTRAERSQRSYEFLRQTLKNKLILGCGAVLSNCYQNFDYVRIGPDVSLDFDDKWFMRFLHRERISTKITIQNTIYRQYYNDFFFGCDPDVFLLRDDNIRLNNKQKESLITINAIFGSLLMTSDNISEYDEEKQELLNRAIEIFKHATDKYFEKVAHNKIKISYKIGEEKYTLIYDTDKGEIIYE